MENQLKRLAKMFNYHKFQNRLSESVFLQGFSTPVMSVLFPFTCNIYENINLKKLSRLATFKELLRNNLLYYISANAEECKMFLIYILSNHLNDPIRNEQAIFIILFRFAILAARIETIIKKYLLPISYCNTTLVR